ncbi:MAG: hypothetical protein ACLPVY_12615, partial [Acidimicrobiia bacterium]
MGARVGCSLGGYMRAALRVAIALVLLLGAGLLYATPASSVVPSWSVVSSISPPGAPNGNILDVACPSATSCFAVGGYQNAAGSVSLAEHWDGATWSRMSLPFTLGSFQSIACPSTTTCFAVDTGVLDSSDTGFNNGSARIARWDGTTWSLMPFPNPGVMPFPNAIVGLASVSCSSDTSCFVVGTVGDSPLIEQWDGSSWSIVPSPNAAGETFSRSLAGVSCASATNCVAVGESSTELGQPRTLIEQWNGTSWSIVLSPSPLGQDDSSLTTVSCPTTTSCFAVGSYSTVDGTTTTLIEAWTGERWSIVASPNTSGTLTDVACSSDTSCFAVGSQIIERWDGTSWSVSPTPVVDPSSVFRGVGCASPTNCFAVGNVGGATALSEHWDGTSWSATTDPAPSPTPSNATLLGVSCATATACFSVGPSLIERPTGTGWSVVATPNGTLSSVSCPT